MITLNEFVFGMIAALFLSPMLTVLWKEYKERKKLRGFLIHESLYADGEVRSADAETSLIETTDTGTYSFDLSMNSYYRD